MELSPEAKHFLKKYENKKIVFTNGCFDIVHRGHVSYLNHARSLGDALFIGLNADASVSRLKGPTRPINTEQDRKFVLENLKCVDCIDIFDEDTPLELIKLVHPMILVKGGDWTPDKIVGSKEVLAWGGQVMSLPFVNGFSTTSIVEKIHKL
ncbi:MAG: D-glycero-beta-D-manno-heptose 1-phosphate adenylyltransferase [Bacteriovoracaceae bacterium]